VFRKGELAAYDINPMPAIYSLNPIEKSKHDTTVPDVEGAHIIGKGWLRRRQAKQLVGDLVPRYVTGKFLVNNRIPPVEAQLTVPHECVDSEGPYKPDIRVSKKQNIRFDARGCCQFENLLHYPSTNGWDRPEQIYCNQICMRPAPPGKPEKAVNPRRYIKYAVW
jgi:hypothetical protein